MHEVFPRKRFWDSYISIYIATRTSDAAPWSMDTGI